MFAAISSSIKMASASLRIARRGSVTSPNTLQGEGETGKGRVGRRLRQGGRGGGGGGEVEGLPDSQAGAGERVSPHRLFIYTKHASRSRFNMCRC
jgi:hypothetical protein